MYLPTKTILSNISIYQNWRKKKTVHDKNRLKVFITTKQSLQKILEERYKQTYSRGHITHTKVTVKQEIKKKGKKKPKK